MADLSRAELEKLKSDVNVAETEANKYINEPIPQRKFGSSVTKSQQLAILQRRQQAQASLANVSKARTQIKEYENYLTYQEGVQAEQEAFQRWASSNQPRSWSSGWSRTSSRPPSYPSNISFSGAVSYNTANLSNATVGELRDISSSPAGSEINIGKYSPETQRIVSSGGLAGVSRVDTIEQTSSYTQPTTTAYRFTSSDDKDFYLIEKSAVSRGTARVSQKDIRWAKGYIGRSKDVESGIIIPASEKARRRIRGEGTRELEIAYGGREALSKEEALKINELYADADAEYKRPNPKDIKTFGEFGELIRYDIRRTMPSLTKEKVKRGWSDIYGKYKSVESKASGFIGKYISENDVRKFYQKSLRGKPKDYLLEDKEYYMLPKGLGGKKMISKAPFESAGEYYRSRDNLKTFLVSTTLEPIQKPVKFAGTSLFAYGIGKYALPAVGSGGKSAYNWLKLDKSPWIVKDTLKYGKKLIAPTIYGAYGYSVYSRVKSSPMPYKTAGEIFGGEVIPTTIGSSLVETGVNKVSDIYRSDIRSTVKIAPPTAQEIRIKSDRSVFMERIKPFSIKQPSTWFDAGFRKLNRAGIKFLPERPLGAFRKGYGYRPIKPDVLEYQLTGGKKGSVFPKAKKGEQFKLAMITNKGYLPPNMPKDYKDYVWFYTATGSGDYLGKSSKLLATGQYGSPSKSGISAYFYKIGKKFKPYGSDIFAPQTSSKPVTYLTGIPRKWVRVNKATGEFKFYSKLFNTKIKTYYPYMKSPRVGYGEMPVAKVEHEAIFTGEAKDIIPIEKQVSFKLSGRKIPVIPKKLMGSGKKINIKEAIREVKFGSGKKGKGFGELIVEKVSNFPSRVDKAFGIGQMPKTTMTSKQQPRISIPKKAGKISSSRYYGDSRYPMISERVSIGGINLIPIPKYAQKKSSKASRYRSSLFSGYSGTSKSYSSKYYTYSISRRQSRQIERSYSSISERKSPPMGSYKFREFDSFDPSPPSYEPTRYSDYNPKPSKSYEPYRRKETSKKRGIKRRARMSESIFVSPSFTAKVAGIYKTVTPKQLKKMTMFGGWEVRPMLNIRRTKRRRK